jgi:20S proteasome subunit beta 1
MAATFDGGVVLGADSRTSTGSYVANRATDKVTRLTERVYVCRSGSAADTQNIAAAVAWHLEQMAVERGGKEAGVLAAARMLSRITYQNKDALQAGLIVAGYDEADANAKSSSASATAGGEGESSNGGVVYAVPLGGTMVRVPFAIGGSGSAYITGLCDKLWRPGMTADECVAFVRRAVAHAIARDGSSGGCIRTVCITKEGAKREFVPGDEVPGTFGDLSQPVGGREGAAAAAAAATAVA